MIFPLFISRSSLSKNILLPQRLIRPVLRFKKYRPALPSTPANATCLSLPQACGFRHSRQAEHALSRCHSHHRISKEYLTNLSTNNDNRLRAGTMPVDRHHSAGLQGIEHSLAIVFRRIPEVHSHSKPRVLFGIGGQIIKYLLIYNLFESLLNQSQ